MSDKPIITTAARRLTTKVVKTVSIDDEINRIRQEIERLKGQEL